MNSEDIKSFDVDLKEQRVVVEGSGNYCSVIGTSQPFLEMFLMILL